MPSLKEPERMRPHSEPTKWDSVLDGMEMIDFSESCVYRVDSSVVHCVVPRI